MAYWKPEIGWNGFISFKVPQKTLINTYLYVCIAVLDGDFGLYITDIFKSFFVH